jgi:crotonobetainyl-CoA:carnitine CoA-transferase CaiB-like acyl-CoA transferase
VAFVDQGGAGIAAFGIMVALFERGKSGMGQHLTTNLLNAVIHMQAFESSGYLIDGSPTFKLGRGAGPVPPMGAYRAKDGDVVTIFGVGPTWPTFCKLLGIEHLEKDPRFESDEKRVEHREELYPLLDEAFSKKARAEWQQIFREARLRCDPCLTYEELFDHPQVAANEMVITMQHPVRGPIRMPGIPVKLKRTPGGPQGPPPLLGQHTKEILVELGYSAQEIDELVEKRVVKVR